MGAVPRLVHSYARYHARGFNIISVSVNDPQDRPELLKFIAEHKMAWPQVHDIRGKIVSPYAPPGGPLGLPLMVLVGRDGRIIAVNPDEDKMDEIIGRALAMKKTAKRTK